MIKSIDKIDVMKKIPLVILLAFVLLIGIIFSNGIGRGNNGFDVEVNDKNIEIEEKSRVECKVNDDCEYRLCLGCFNKNAPLEEHTGDACLGGSINYRDVCTCIEGLCIYSQKETSDNFPQQPTQKEREDAKKLPKDQCGCWDSINNVCLPQADCM